MQTTNKKYWLRFGITFFVIFLVIFLYAAFTINNNHANVRSMMVAEPQPFTIVDAIQYLPGLSILVGFGIAGMGGLLVGSVLLSALYGVIGSIIGGIYGKLKKNS